jgi:hypothetical protein
MAELRLVIAKARAGDATVVPQLRAILDRHPILVEHYGNIARQAENAWVSLTAGNNLYLKETLARAGDVRRAGLTRPGASPIEKLLVERVVASGLELNYFSAAEANAISADESPRLLQFRAWRLSQAQRMHLAAVGALVAYQKLMPVPVIAPVEKACAETTATHEEPVPVQNFVDRVPQPVSTIRVTSEVTESEFEERELVRIRIGG